MGAFDFAELDPEKLIQIIKDEELDIQDLDITVDGETVTISGTVASEDIQSKAVSLLKSAEGVSSVVDELTVSESESEASKDVGESGTKHVVVSGDTLWGISEKYYGDGSKYMKIFEANKELWKSYNYDPNVLYPNWELNIP